MSWQPIESAPKDGTPHLQFHKKSGETRVSYWWKSESSNLQGWSYVLCTDPQTHWMPLPEPPK